MPCKHVASGSIVSKGLGHDVKCSEGHSISGESFAL